MDGDRDGSYPSRRRVLTGATAAGMVVLAGCTEDVGGELPANEHWPVADLVPDLPVRERTEVLEDGIEDGASAAVDDVDGFVAALDERGITFESVEMVAEALHVEHVAADFEHHGTLRIIATVAGAYAGLVAAGVEPRALELVLFRPDGQTIGVVEVATDWAVAYTTGQLSAAAFGEHVVATIESRREPPDPDVAPEE